MFHNGYLALSLMDPMQGQREKKRLELGQKELGLDSRVTVFLY